MTSDIRPEATTSTPTRFTVVSAIHNVARYLPDFIASIESQSFPLDRVDVVAVDDGSDDDSLTVLEEWAARRPDLVTVLTQTNAGQGAARNAGLQYARGEWVTFADPDDMLDENYFSNVDRFLVRHPETDMIATNRLIFTEATGEVSERHPLRHMFRGKDDLVDLTRFPGRFHGSAPAAFLKHEVLKQEDLRFDSRIRPNFEDGHLCARYLLTRSDPAVGFVSSARYIYRKRADQSSTLQTGAMNPGRFTAVPRFGYLDVLKRGAERFGKPPEWLQNFVLYELSFYFSQDIAMSSAQTAARGNVAQEFRSLLGQIAAYLDPEIIESFDVRRFDREWAQILLHGLGNEPWHSPYIIATKYDAAKRQVLLATDMSAIHHGK